jgi:hypothetical protein
MNEKSDAKYQGIIINRGAENDFVKIKGIIDEQVRDDQFRLATRGENEEANDARAMSATNPSNRRNSGKDLGPIVPGKLYITNKVYHDY